MQATEKIYSDEEQSIFRLLEEVSDPEVPVLSVIDLGIIRNVECTEPKKSVDITITPTYSGCPAMDVIAMNIRFALLQNGYTKIGINMNLFPAWTTDWMTPNGKDKLRAYGIAPPGRLNKTTPALFAEPAMVQCPLCNSYNTKMISEFGSTSCKSLYQCKDCSEPFDHFKCH